MSDAKEYSFILGGVNAEDLSLALLRDFVDLLVEGASRVTRLAVEGRSVARGAPPAWLANAMNLRVTKYDRGSLVLGLSATRLQDAVPELFAQPALFPELARPGDSAVDLLLAAMDDATNGRGDSERLDAGVLEVLSRTATLFARGATSIEVVRAGGPRFSMSSEQVGSIVRLCEDTPEPRVDRVAGSLDSVTVSTKTFALKMQDGSRLRGIATSLDLEKLGPLLGKNVVAEGAVSFRPSGMPLRIEADFVGPSAAGDIVWARLPRGDKPLQRTNGIELASIVGQWPGNESEEEIFEALRDLS